MKQHQFHRTFRTFLSVAAFAALIAITSLFQDQRLLAAKQSPQRQTTSRPAQQKVLDWEKLTEQQFKQLPDSQPIMFEGKRSTLGEVRATARTQQQQVAQKQAAARAKMVQTKAPSTARLAIDQLLRTQEQKFAAENTKVQNELKRLRQLGPVTTHGKTTTELRVSTQKPGGFDSLPPRITKVFGMIHPGGAVLIGGNGFGNITGRVRMIVPNASWEILLEKLEWHPTGIAGRIPNNPALVKGPSFRFVVETKAGEKSNEWPVNWLIEVKLLPQKDVRVVSCSAGGNGNKCNGLNAPGFCGFWHSWVHINDQMQTASLWGTHTNCGNVGDDNGTDFYEIKLKNGWVLQEYDFGFAVSGEDEGWVREPLAFAGAFPRGSTWWKPNIGWSVTPKDMVGYWAYIYISGPKGVPHK